jgi:transposase-like protein
MSQLILYLSGIYQSKHNLSTLKVRHGESEIILLCVRWYLLYQLSHLDLEERMRTLSLSVDHTTIF